MRVKRDIGAFVINDFGDSIRLEKDAIIAAMYLPFKVLLLNGDIELI